MKSTLKQGATLRAGRYEIERPLRGGTEKQVYLAHDRNLRCQVALDVFADDAVMSGGLSVSAWEAQVLGNLGDHRNLGDVLDHWEEDGAAFMVSRYLSGGSLSDLIAGHRDGETTLSAGEILRIATEIARGLAHIHEHRIVYRDLQPQNVLFDQWSAIRLVDFDTACPLDGSEMSDISGRPVVAYMAPEELEGGPADEKADLYSLGATIYEMCSGRPPIVGDRTEIIDARRSGEPSPLGREDLPEDLLQLTFKLLAADPNQRPTNAAEVVRSLEQVHADRAALEALLKSDESATLEFKSSLCVPDEDLPDHLDEKQRKAREQQLKRSIQQSVSKTIAAFLNSEGGKLIIGFKEGGSVIGIEKDYPEVKEESRDGWLLTFDEVISRDLGPEVMTSMDVQLEPIEDRTVAVVSCTPRKEPTWLGSDGLCFIRRTASTEQLSPKETLTWYQERSGRYAP